MTSSCSYSAIGQTVSLCSISPLVLLLPHLLLPTALYAHSGPHAMLLHVLLCVATYRPLNVRTLASTGVHRPCMTLKLRATLPLPLLHLAALYCRTCSLTLLPFPQSLISLRTCALVTLATALRFLLSCVPTTPPPMYITLYYIVRDHFLSVCPTTLTVDLLEQRLLAAETSIVGVGASRGDRRTPVFEGCSPSPLLPSVASAATADFGGFESVGAASAPSGRCRPGRSKGGKGTGGTSGGGGGGGGGSGGG
ncbi:unnamed protein product [Closterium sp. NIES-53]